MQPYVEQKYLPVKGLFLLAIGAIVSGVAIGIAAYFFSGVFYLHFVFPLLIGVFAIIPFKKIQDFSKIKGQKIVSIFGLLFGLLIAVSFYATPWLIDKKDGVAYLQEEYQIDKRTASLVYEDFVKQETGSSGLYGFMKFRAQMGESYTNYLMINSVVINESSYTVRSYWAWIYWIIETILFCSPSVFLLGRGKDYFNKNTKEWYGNLQQIGSTPLKNKQSLLDLLHSNDARGICELLEPEETTSHPALELYFAQTKNAQDVLLLIKQTERKSPTKVSRNTISEWEISLNDLNLFKDEVGRKLEENNVASASG